MTMLSLEAEASSSPECENWTYQTSSLCFSSTWCVWRGMTSREHEKSSKSDEALPTPAKLRRGSG